MTRPSPRSPPATAAGQRPSDQKTGKPLCVAASARIAAAESAYCRQYTVPLEKAALALTRTPAPDLYALRAKIEVMRDHEVDCFNGTPSDPLDVIWEDVRRLATNSV